MEVIFVLKIQVILHIYLNNISTGSVPKNHPLNHIWRILLKNRKFSSVKECLLINLQNHSSLLLLGPTRWLLFDIKIPA